MAILKRLDKRTGITYVYDSVSYWDKKKKQPRSKRTLIGKIDPNTGEMIPTDGRCKHLSTEGKKQAAKQKKKEQETQAKQKEQSDKKLVTETTRKFYGATYLLNSIAEKSGLMAALKQCFPDTYRQILSLAYFLILEDSSALSRFPRWSRLHEHPYGADIPSQRSSELLRSITENDKMAFFKHLINNRSQQEYWAYDSTSISSYSEQLKQVRYGYNKDYDPLAQINLLLVFGEESNLPIYYRQISGNIPDVKTVASLIAEIEPLGVNKVKLLMDRGFYSTENINTMLKERIKFLIGVSSSLDEVQNAIDENRDSIRSFENFYDQHDVFGVTKKIDWITTNKQKNNNVRTKVHNMYLHLYFNTVRAAEDEKRFMKRLAKLRTELLEDKRVASNETSYKKYFTTKIVRGEIQVEVKQNAIKKAQRSFGYFALLSNDIKDAGEALDKYRGRDVVEKAFSNVKERLHCDRVHVSTEESLNGKLFIHFVGLHLLSYITKQMRKHLMFKEYTLSSILDELDAIELIQAPGCKPFVREVLNKQIDIYEKMEVTPISGYIS